MYYGKLAGGVGVDGWGDLSGSQPQLLGPGQRGHFLGRFTIKSGTIEAQIKARKETNTKKCRRKSLL